MGIRPEEVQVARDADLPGGVAARVKVTEPVGGDMLVGVALDPSELLVKTKPSFQAEMDSPCRIAFDTGRWHVFAKDNGVAYF
jgi:ABC-type sugar transport system ATPase subunit